MQATNIACPRCKAVQRSSQPSVGGKPLQCKQCGALLAVSAVSAAPPAGVRPLSPRHAVEPVAAPSNLPIDPVGRPRVLAAIVVGAMVLLCACVALVVYCCQPADTAAQERTDATDPESFVVAGSSEIPVGNPPPAPTAVENKPDPPAVKVDAETKQDPPPVKVDPVDPPVPPRPEPRPAKAVPPPAVKVALGPEQKRINNAIDNGVKFLKSTQFNKGRWDNGPHPVGYAALPGLTLLECGVPANDPVVKGAAKFVREHVKTLTATYELALAILFLDRLGDSRDKELIQTLAIRLIAGQNATGGWTYHCPVLGSPDQKHLLAFLRRTQTPLMDPLPLAGSATANPLGKGPTNSTGDGLLAQTSDPLPNPIQKPVGPNAGTQPDPAPMKPERKAAAPEKKKNSPKASVKNDPLPARLKTLPVVHMNDGAVRPPAQKGMVKPRARLRGESGDNSNTQFAILALWVARRHGVPMERTLALIDHRFQTSQNEDGGWGYHYEGGAAFTKPSMTCVGLLGLAVSHGFAQEIAAAMKNAKDVAPPKKGEEDLAIQRGLKKLGQYVGTPTRTRLPGGMFDLYTLWSIERVGVLYNLKTIGNKDWYAWAAQLLLTHQNPNGSWWARGYPGSSTTIDTCFALLILRRVNLVQDLTDNLRMLAITDPDSGTRATPGR